MEFKRVFENKKFRAAVIIFITAVSFITIYLFNPSEYTYFPPCYLKLLTGKLCPGCGGMRSIYHFMHGNLYEAMKYNLLLPLFLVFGLYYLVSQFSIIFFDKPFPDIISKKYVFYSLLAIMIVYWVVRNL